MIDLKNLCKFNKIAIAIHTRPDGDAIGSSSALKLGFSQLGKDVDLLCDCCVPEKLRFLSGVGEYKKTADVKYDLVVFCDCGDESRIGAIKLDLKGSKVAIIDHHATSESSGDYNMIYPNVSSASEIVLEILEANGLEITSDMANLLYTGLMTDTGNFCHTNVTAKTFEHAAKLVSYGANPNLLSRRVFKLLEGNKYKLVGSALQSVRLFDDGKVAYIYISKDMLEKTGCDVSETEGIIDFALSIEGVQIAAVMTDGVKSGSYKISLRSIDGIDVSRAAATVGGGGHKQASGCMLFGEYYEAEEKLLNLLSKYTV